MNPKRAVLGSMLLLGIGAVVLSFISDGSGSVSPASVAAEIITPDSDAVAGRALPFNIIGAIRNFGFQGGLVAAQISVSVDGGVPADWTATAIYIAEHS